MKSWFFLFTNVNKGNRTFEHLDHEQMIEHLINSCAESSIFERYLPPDLVANWLGKLPPEIAVLELGRSVLDRPIYAIEIGSGPEKILGWSQMHGNEPTTTMAVIDLLNLFILHPELDGVKDVLDSYRLHLILQLNPDGAAAYTRENANEVDLNRDAEQRTQPESQILADYFDRIQPDLCLNLHDQRSIYGFVNGKPAALSFLAPAADSDRTLTKARKAAIKHIDRMLCGLAPVLPGMIGRYDDTFNPNCVGDRFQTLDCPTILFEAGHMEGDYQRQRARRHVLRALLLLLGFKSEHHIPIHYHMLPENLKNHHDIIFRNGKFGDLEILQDLAVRYDEVLEQGRLSFVPVISKLGVEKGQFGHKEVDLEGSVILVNSCENVFETEKLLTITEKYPPNREFFANM